MSTATPKPSPSKRLAFFDNAFARDPSDEITLKELVDLIRTGRWRDQVEQLRQLLAAGDRNEYDSAKRSLPTIMLSGWADTRKKDAPDEKRAIHHSGFLQGDFDGKDHPHLLDEHATDPAARVKPLMDLLRADPHVVAAFISPSGEGVKAVIRIVADTASHRGSFEAVAEHFSAFGLKIDEATKDPGRLCFASFDPDAWMRDPSIVPLIRPKKQAARGESNFDPMDATYDDVREMLSFIPPRPDYEDWLRIASAVWSVLDETTGIKLLNEWSPEERPGEYLRKFKNRLRDVRIGTLAWYAQAHGFDAKEAARRKRWAGRIRFADGKQAARPVEIAPDHADGPKRVSNVDGPEDEDNPQFVEWCLTHEQRGDAELWQAIAQGTRMWDHYAGCWRRWNGASWDRDDLEGVKLEFVDSLCGAYRQLKGELQKDVAKKPSENPKTDPRRILMKKVDDRVSSLNRVNWLRGSIEISRSMTKLATRANAFDRHPHLLALENGVLDFDACEFREAHPSDMLTHRAGVRFDPEATCPKFDAFLARMLVDPEVVAFVLRAMAYSLTGKVDEDVLFFLYGKGANGKSTFMLIFKLLLGELMVTIDVETLLARKSDANLDYKKSTLEGRRVAVTDEVPENRKLGESMVKALIGGDEIVARRPYEKPYTFSPTHKLWMVGNHKPVIEGTDAGIWRRICLIPWTQTIPVEERRPRAQVIAEMRKELPGILNRLLVAWQEFRDLGGLKPPKAVQDATNEYQHEQDQLALFLEDRTERIIGGSVAAKSLHETYLAWCEDNGEEPKYKIVRQMTKRLGDMGYVVQKDRKSFTFIEGIEKISLDS